MMKYFYNVLIGIDQLANTLLAGDPDETISSRAGKKMTKCKGCRWLCRVLNIFDNNHCIESIESGEGGRELWKW